MFYWIMSTCFKDIEKSNHITFNIGIWICNRITHTSLCTQIDNNIWIILLENTVNKLFICKIALDKSIVFKLLKLCKTSLLNTNIIVIIHIIKTNNLRVCFSSQNAFCKV